MERSKAFESLIADAHAFLKERQALLEKEFRFSNWPRYDWSQDSAQLIFSENGVAQVIASIQFVGSISTVSDTWLWAWANDSVEPQLCKRLDAVRSYGQQHHLPHLTNKKWHAHEVDGWEMTAIAALLTQACGAYRTPKETGFTFMVMTDIGWAA